MNIRGTFVSQKLGNQASSATLLPANWGVDGEDQYKPADVWMNCSARKGCRVPSIIAGSWGNLYKPSGTRFRVLFEWRSRFTTGGAWTEWRNDFGWELLGASRVNEATGTQFQYRWRCPVPYTNYLRIEWDHMDQIGTGAAAVTSVVFDPCYRAWLVRDTGGFGYLSPINDTILSGFFARPRMLSGERRVVSRAPFDDLVLAITASDITLRGIAAGRSGSSLGLAPGYHDLTFSPPGPSGRALAKKLYADQLLTGNETERFVGAILDSPGPACTSRLSITAATGTRFVPRYNGGDIESAEVVSGNCPNLGTSFCVMPTGFDVAAFSGVVGRLIRSGPGLSYSALSATIAARPEGYHPFVPSTWPTTPVVNMNPSAENTVRRITLPRFFIHA